MLGAYPTIVLLSLSPWEVTLGAWTPTAPVYKHSRAKWIPSQRRTMSFEPLHKSKYNTHSAKECPGRMLMGEHGDDISRRGDVLIVRHIGAQDHPYSILTAGSVISLLIHILCLLRTLSSVTSFIYTYSISRLSSFVISVIIISPLGLLYQYWPYRGRQKFIEFPYCPFMWVH